MDYFDRHGLNELPLPTHNEEDSHHLPRVTPLEPIVNDWEQLPIDSQALNALTDEEIKQQRTIWELIHTEYSHLQTLETIINVSEGVGFTEASKGSKLCDKFLRNVKIVVYSFKTFSGLESAQVFSMCYDLACTLTIKTKQIISFVSCWDS